MSHSSYIGAQCCASRPARLQKIRVQATENADELDESSDQVVDILNYMLRTKPIDRFTADEC